MALEWASVAVASVAASALALAVSAAAKALAQVESSCHCGSSHNMLRYVEVHYDSQLGSDEDNSHRYRRASSVRS